MSEPTGESVREAVRNVVGECDAAECYSCNQLTTDALVDLVRETGISWEMVEDVVVVNRFLGGDRPRPETPLTRVARALSAILDAAQIPRSETK